MDNQQLTVVSPSTNTDRLSNLPTFILHNIISMLSERQAARSSVLSKAWGEAYFTFPILSFSDSKFWWKRDCFINYVMKTLLRFKDKSLAIKQFKLCLSSDSFDWSDMSENVDVWFNLVSETSIQVLELSLPHVPYLYGLYLGLYLGKSYTLPKGVIEAKSLTKLVLTGAIIVDQSFTNHSIKFFSLTILSLDGVLSRDEHAIEHLISSCPLIQHIALKQCLVLSHDGHTRDLNSLSMHGLLNLKTLEVWGIHDLYIDAPRLENFRCFPSAKIDFDRCKNLKELDLSFSSHVLTPDKWFLELFPKFPFLESLKLMNCMSQRINISSAQLKVLELYHPPNLMELNVDAPNLLSCEYRFFVRHSKPHISFLTTSSQLQVHLQISTGDVFKFRDVLENINPLNVLTSLSLFICQPIVMKPSNQVVFQGSSSPPSIKCLHLSTVPENEYLFSSFVKILLSCCRPATISLSPNSSLCMKFIEIFYWMLRGIEYDDDCICSSSDTKCWWHDLKDVKVTTSQKICEKIVWHDLKDAKVTTSLKICENIDWKTFLRWLRTSPPFPPGAVISFSLEH